MALTITALVQTKKNELSFYHAIIIFHLVVFLGINVRHTGSYRGTFSRIFIRSIGTWTTLTLFFAWATHLWFTAPIFGSDPEGCNPNDEVQYVVFFKSVKATAPGWRWFCAGLVIAGLVFLVVTPLITTLLWLASIVWGVQPIDSVSTRGFEIQKWKSDRAAPIRFLLSIYSVVNLELVIRRNISIVKEGEDEWGFGQIAAMVVLLSPFNELLHAFLNLCAYDGPKKTRRIGLLRALMRIVPFGSYFFSKWFALN